MKIRQLLFSLILVLFTAFLIQTLVTVTQLGKAIDNSAVYAQLQQDKSQLEMKKNQYLTEYAQMQALKNISQSQLVTEQYIAMAEPLVLTAPATALASNLPEEGRLE